MFVTLRSVYQAPIHLKPVDNLLLVLINIADAFVKHSMFLLISSRHLLLIISFRILDCCPFFCCWIIQRGKSGSK